MEIQEFIARWLPMAKGAVTDLSEDEMIMAGVVGIAIYIGWLIFLFSWFRPRLAIWLSRILNVTIVNSLISGSWEISKGGNFGKSLLLFLIEIVVFIGGAFGPFLIIGLLLFA